MTKISRDTAFGLAHQLLTDAIGVAGQEVSECPSCMELVEDKNKKLAEGLELRRDRIGRRITCLAIDDVVWPQKPNTFVVGYGNWLRNNHQTRH